MEFEIPQDKQLVLVFISLFCFVALLPSVLLGKIKPIKLVIGALSIVAIGLVSGLALSILTGIEYLIIITLQPIPYAWAARYVGGSYIFAIALIALYFVSLLKIIIVGNKNA